MPIVGGFDIHRSQITSDNADTVTGHVWRGRIEPACGTVLPASLARCTRASVRRPPLAPDHAPWAWPSASPDYSVSASRKDSYQFGTGAQPHPAKALTRSDPADKG